MGTRSAEGPPSRAPCRSALLARVRGDEPAEAGGMDPRGPSERPDAAPDAQADLASFHARRLMGGRETAIVLLSGGMDSAVVAALACRDHEAAFLHLDYGQRTEDRE